MPCNRARLMLLAYVHGELPEIAASEVASHIAGCPACAREHALLRDEIGRFSAVLRAEAPPNLHTDVMGRLRRASLPRVGSRAGCPGATVRRADLLRLLRAGALLAASVALAIAGLAFLWPAAGDALVSGAARLGSQFVRYAGERSYVWPGLIRAAGALRSLAGL